MRRQKQLTLSFLTPPQLTTLVEVPIFNEFQHPTMLAENCVYCGEPLTGPTTEVLGKVMHAHCERKFYVEYNRLDQPEDR